MKTLVMKFGGTSVGGAAAIAQAGEIVRQAREQWPRLAVVVSAMSGVTDLLLEGAHAAASGNLARLGQIAAALRQQHLQALRGLIDRADESFDRAQDARRAVEAPIRDRLNEFENLCRAVSVLGEASPRALDAILALGERMSVHLFAGRLRHIGLPAEPVDATEVIRTDGVFQSAAPIMDVTRRQAQRRLGALFAQKVIPVVTGFIGAAESGAVTTLGRGGSDYTAAILGAALDAEAVWIYTDVDGVMTADPRTVSGARSLAALSYREVAELAYFGAKVLHPKTILPVVERGIGLRIKNTFNPAHPGTLVLAEPDGANGSLKAVTAIQQQSLITVEGRGMLGVPGIAARTFGAVARTRTNVPMISQASSEQSICFLVPSAAAEEVVARLRQEFAQEIARRDIERIWSLDEVVIVTVVGAAMRYTPGIAGRVFGALGAANINVLAIAQGSSECSISLVVAASDGDAAVRSIHALIQ